MNEHMNWKLKSRIWLNRHITAFAVIVSISVAGSGIASAQDTIEMDPNWLSTDFDGIEIDSIFLGAGFGDVEIGSGFIEVSSFSPDIEAFDSIATLLGISVHTLFAEHSKGRTLADIAVQYNVSPTDIVDLQVATEEVLINITFKSGAITVLEAEQWKADLRAAIRFDIYNIAPDLHTIAAEIIGLSVDELTREIFITAPTKSIAELALAGGIDPQIIIDKYAAAENAYTNKMLFEGLLSTEEAKSNSEQFLQFAESMLFSKPSEFDLLLPQNSHSALPFGFAN